MKKAIFILSILFATASFAQEKPKQDTTIIVTAKIEDFRRLLYLIDMNVDSKKVSAEIINFLQQSARIAEPPKKEQPKK